MRNLSAREKLRREAAQRWGIAAGVALVAGFFLAWAVVASYGPVRPRVECVMPLGTGTYVAYFGYANSKAEVVAIPIGDDNEVVGPGTAPDGQPTVFAPGSSPAFPSAAFAVTFAASDKVRWTLGPRTVVATRDSAACPIPEAQPLPPPESVVLPKRIEVVKLEPPPEPPKVIEPPKDPKPPEPPKSDPARPRVKDPSKPVPKQVLVANVEPMPLMIEALSNGPTDVVVTAGETTLGDDRAFGTVQRSAPATTPPSDVGVPGGTGTPAREVVRRSARPKTRPQGRWPDDAPPRAGSVAVRLSALVGVDGKVKSVKVIAGAGGAFDREARAVVLSVVFEPASEDGVPVESWVPWVVEFTPDE